MPAPTPFSATVAERQRSGHTVSFHLGDDWQQGRTAYGGVVAAVAAQAMRDVAGADWPAEVSLRSLQCAFVSVVEPGPVQVQVEVLRQGRNVCQVLARLSERGRLGTVAIGVYSADRPSSLTQRRLQRPMPRAEADRLPAMPYVQGPMPPFLQHVEMRPCDGARPFSGTPHHALDDPPAPARRRRARHRARGADRAAGRRAGHTGAVGTPPRRCPAAA